MTFYRPEFIQHLFDYLVAADKVGLAAAREVPETEYYKDRGFSAGSIHNLLVHQMAAQKIWLERWNGASPAPIEDQQTYPTRQSLADRWPAVHRDVLEFVSEQTEQSLNAPMTVYRSNGEAITLPLGAMMIHVTDHGTYHRGQLASMLKLAGVNPPYVPYFRFAAQTQVQS